MYQKYKSKGITYVGGKMKNRHLRMLNPRLDSTTVKQNEPASQFDGEKGIRYDINCVLADGTTAQVEMQGYDKKCEYAKRAEYYAARLASSAPHVGDDWNELPRSYQISVLNFTYDKGNFNPLHHYTMTDISDGSILGGIPFYLSLFNDTRSIKENIIKNCLSTTGVLFNEIETLLRMELKETYFYKSIMLAINAGASTLNTIKDKVGEEPAKVAKYLNVLCNLGFIKKEIPCGEKQNTRNTLYSICDNYFSFYFMFIFKKHNMLNGLISPELYYEREFTKEKLNTFIGHRFETICETYLKEQFYNGKMPFFAENLGRWWGNNPVLKKQEEIDILAFDDSNVLFCECKYTEDKFNEKELKDLQDASLCMNRPNKYFMIFAKNGVSSGVKKQIGNNNSYFVITLEDLKNELSTSQSK